MKQELSWFALFSQTLKTYGIGLIFLLLQGCGFHLEGMQDMPRWLNNVAIINQNAHRDLKPTLIEELKGYGINICTNINKASYWLILEDDKNSEFITSVSSSTTPRQFQMTYAVKYKLQQANGKEIIPSSNAVVTRQFTINSNRVLGSDYEGDLLKKEMDKEAANQILEHIKDIKIQ
jgi:LPS-assembly lipoprotein